MNSNDLFDIIGETPEWYVLDAANVHTKVISTGKRSPKRVWLIAAIIAAMVFLMGCAVVYILSLDQMILGTDYVEDQPGVTEPGSRCRATWEVRPIRLPRNGMIFCRATIRTMPSGFPRKLTAWSSLRTIRITISTPLQ